MSLRTQPLLCKERHINAILHGVFDQRYFRRGDKNAPPINFKTKSHGITKFSMRVGVNQNFLEKLVLSS